MKIFGYNISKITKPANAVVKSFPVRYSNMTLNNLFDDIQVNKDLLYRMYRQNPDVRSAIRKKALYVGSAWMQLLDKDQNTLDRAKHKKEYDEIQVILNNPTFMDTKVEMLKHLDVCGELYLLPTTDPAGKINGFQLLHPKTIQKVFEDGEIVGFKQMVGSALKYYYADASSAKDKKLVLKYYVLEKHTDNEINGMWLLEGLVYDVMSDMKAQERNYYTLDNDSTPGGMLILEEWISEEEQNLLVQQLEMKHKGTKNSGKPMLAPWVKDWKMTTLSPKEMEHILQRKMTTEKVCSAIGVPKSILNYTDSVNYNTSLNDRREFIEGTINNYQRLLEFIINDFLTTFYGEKYPQVHFVDHEVEDDIEVTKIHLAEVKGWSLTINEYRALKGRAALTDENADKPLITKDTFLLEDITLDPVLAMDNT